MRLGELCEGPAGLYVITGDPDAGYEVHPVGPATGTVYRRKYEARTAVRTDAVRAADQ